MVRVIWWWVMEVLVVDGLDLMLKYPGTTVGLTRNIEKGDWHA